MAAVFSKAFTAGILTEKLATNQILVILFSNDVTITADTTFASFDVVEGGGYSHQAVAPGDWVITPGNPSTAVAPPVEFLFTDETDAPGTIYGFILFDAIEGYICGEQFTSGIVPLIPVTGSSIVITPEMACV